METLNLKQLASCIDARHRNQKLGREDWVNQFDEKIQELIKCLPSGSGFDAGTKLNLSDSKAEKIVFETKFHHLNERGFYEGWTSHSIIITPSLQFGYKMRITGPNKHDIKEYIREVFDNLLKNMRCASV